MTTSRGPVDSRVVPHVMHRIDITTTVPFDDFVAALDRAAPAFDPTTVQRIAAADGDWDDVRAEAAKAAPNDLLTYLKFDASEIFSIAGHRTRAFEYLVGNHVIAETMFRHDATALLYAPLRMLVYSDAHGNAVFTMDQPGPAFGSLGIDEVTKVGRELDGKVANLLRVVGVDVGQAFD